MFLKAGKPGGDKFLVSEPCSAFSLGGGSGDFSGTHQLSLLKGASRDKSLTCSFWREWAAKTAGSQVANTASSENRGSVKISDTCWEGRDSLIWLTVLSGSGETGSFDHGSYPLSSPHQPSHSISAFAWWSWMGRKEKKRMAHLPFHSKGTTYAGNICMVHAVKIISGEARVEGGPVIYCHNLLSVGCAWMWLVCACDVRL